MPVYDNDCNTNKTLTIYIDENDPPILNASKLLD